MKPLRSYIIGVQFALRNAKLLSGRRESRIGRYSVLNDSLVLTKQNALTAALATQRVTNNIIVAVHLVKEPVTSAHPLACHVRTKNLSDYVI